MEINFRDIIRGKENETTTFCEDAKRREFESRLASFLWETANNFEDVNNSRLGRKQLTDKVANNIKARTE